MGAYFDCSSETIEKYGKCIDRGLPIKTQSDIIDFFGVGFNAYQLAATHVLFVMLLTMIVMIVDIWKIRRPHRK